MKQTSLYSLRLQDLEEACTQQGLPNHVASQVFYWFYKRNGLHPNHWPNVSRKAKDFLLKHYDLNPPRIIWRQRSYDGTRKYLLQMSDQQTVEAVIIFSEKRRTLCLSSQIGCAVGCTFCHTGTMGFKRNLSAAEIVGQYLSVSQDLEREGIHRPTNIVYMGQGEPLLNFRAVRTSIEIFMETKGLALGQRKITISTSGAVFKMKELQNFPPVNIAISLHGVDDDTRTKLIPTNKKAGLVGLLEAIKTIPLKAHRRITYEYILIDQMNDRKKDIEGLSRLLNTERSKINLIPFNEYPQSSFKCPSKEKIDWFQSELQKRGFTCTVRATKGKDILAACGQLKSVYKS